MNTKVIVVDDSQTARHQVRSALVEAGYEVVEAIDGRDGLNKVAAHPDARVVVCDVNMPVMGGLEMLDAVKQDGVHGALPFLMLTTEVQIEMVQRARKSGASGWVVKPFKPHLLVAAVRKLAG